MLQESVDIMRSRAEPLPVGKRGAGFVAALVVGAILLAAIAASLWFVSQRPASSVIRLDIAPSTPPLPPPLKEGFVPLDRAKAEEVNLGIAASNAPIEPARPFVVPTADILSRQSAADCLTAAIYYEAASETDKGQRAVAQVVLNRVRHPAFPKSVCGVVYQGAERKTGCQFSFTCDGSLARIPSKAGWERARGIALAALAGAVEPSVGTATHYHTIWVVPYWAWTLDKITTLDAHIFYRWRGFWGKRAAFTGSYAGENEAGQAMALSEAPIEMPGDPAMTEVKPMGPRLLADELQQLSPAARAAGEPVAAPPKADQDKGKLVADENAGALVGPAAAAPKPN